MKRLRAFFGWLRKILETLVAQQAAQTELLRLLTQQLAGEGPPRMHTHEGTPCDCGHIHQTKYHSAGGTQCPTCHEQARQVTDPAYRAHT